MRNSGVNIAVIGCGYWGKNIVRNMSEIGALVAVCDDNKQLGEDISKQYDVPLLSWDAILADPNIQAIAIAAPAALHFKLAYSAIEAGKDVFVEKPLALQMQDAQKLSDYAAQEGRVLMVGHLLHYHPAYLKLKEMVSEGIFGELSYVYSNRLSLGKIRAEEDVLWSFAPHDISMVLGLVSEDVESVACKASYLMNTSIADSCVTHIRFNNGMHGHVFVSWLHPFKEQRLVVVGNKGMAVFDDSQDWDNKLKFYAHTVSLENGESVIVRAEAQGIKIQSAEPLKSECEHFVDCIKARSIPRTDGTEGVRVLEVLNAASESMAKGGGRVSKNTNLLPGVSVHESAYIDTPVRIGAGTKIWHFSHVLPNTEIGENCVIGQNCVLGPDVIIGNQCKIQNNVSLYKGVILEDGVFCGPSCVFTNVNNPRAEIERKSEYRKTHVKRGVTIGANATIICGHSLGEYAFIAAGAVVACDVVPYALMAGVPAKRIGWMSRSGGKLGLDLICPIDGTQYQEQDGQLHELAPFRKDA